MGERVEEAGAETGGEGYASVVFDAGEGDGSGGLGFEFCFAEGDVAG